jgi:hypothetical protein
VAPQNTPDPLIKSRIQGGREANVTRESTYF